MFFLTEYCLQPEVSIPHWFRIQWRKGTMSVRDIHTDGRTDIRNFPPHNIGYFATFQKCWDGWMAGWLEFSQ